MKIVIIIFVVLLVLMVLSILTEGIDKKTTGKENKKNNDKNQVEIWIDEGQQVYRSKKQLMTPTEQDFYRHLLTIYSLTGHVFAQVRVVDVINVNWSATGKNTFKEKVAFNQLIRWHVDYVITDSNFNIIKAIELDDASHQKPDRQKRDRILNLAFQSAGIKLIRHKVGQEYPAKNGFYFN